MQEQKIFIDQKISDYIPIASHYDANTLITKSGDLIQIINITGFEPNDQDFNISCLRDKIREYCAGHINNNKIAIYIHTLNNHTNIEVKAEFTSPLCEDLYKQWNENHNWRNMLIPTIYISVIFQGAREHPLDLNYMHEIFFFHFYKKHHMRVFDENLAILNNIVDNFINYISRFGARKLGIYENPSDKIYYSELITFLYQLIHLDKKNIPLLEYAICDYLADIQLDYMFNSIVIQAEGNHIYAAVFSFKPMQDVMMLDCSAILSCDFEYIITESMLFAPKRLATKGFIKQHTFLEIAQDESIIEALKLKEYMSAEISKQSDYCESQMIIMLYNTDQEQLQLNIEAFMAKITAAGIIAVREDFFMPLAFWSNIPGNFIYRCRKNYNLTKYAAQFAFVPSAAMGSYNGSKWGSPVCLFDTVSGLPYYFNFHKNDNGHTMIVGPDESGKTLLMRFLLMHATKYQPQVIFLDLQTSNENFINSLQGEYHTLTVDINSPIKMNIWDANLYNNDLKWAEEIFYYLLYDIHFQDAERKKLVEKMLLSVQKKENAQEAFARLIAETPEELQEQLKQSLESFIKNFCSENVIIPPSNSKIIGYNFSRIEKHLMQVFVELFLLSLPKKLNNNEPTIVIIHHAECILNNLISLERFLANIESCNNKNIMMLMTFEYHQEMINDVDQIRKILSFLGSSIFLANRMADRIFKKVFMLTDREFDAIRGYFHGKRTILLKQNHLLQEGRISKRLFFDVQRLHPETLKILVK